MGLCKICGNSQENNLFIAREMMSGSREEFAYLECAACGCVQLVSQPDDMSDYYANDTYGSFGGSSASFLKSAIRNYRNKFAIFGEGGWLTQLSTPICESDINCYWLERQIMFLGIKLEAW